MKRKVLAIAPLAFFLAWHPAQSRQTEGQNCRRVKSAATGMMTTHCDKPRSQPTTGGTLYYPGDAIPSPQQQTRIPPPADGGFQPPDLSRDPEYARSPAPARSLERFRGSITYSGSYFGRVTGPQNKNPGSFTYRGSGGNVRVPNPFDLMPKMNDVQGAIRFELEFNNGQVTARYYPNGFLQAGSARGTFQNGQCVLYDDAGGMPWSGTCGDFGFNGSITLGQQSEAKGTINFQTAKTTMVDFVERDRLNAERERANAERERLASIERRKQDAILARQRQSAPRNASIGITSQSAPSTTRPVAPTLKGQPSIGRVSASCLDFSQRRGQGSRSFYQPPNDIMQSSWEPGPILQDVTYSCGWPDRANSVQINLTLSTIRIFGDGCHDSAAEDSTFTLHFTRNKTLATIATPYRCIESVNSVKFN